LKFSSETGAVLETLLLIVAAAAFAGGGLLMKLSVGMTRLLPTLGFLILFCAGAALQAVAMRKAELGMAYIFVLGAEAVMTMLFSVYALGESCPPGRAFAIVLITAGIALLRAS
jgi:multidrug transporter EmrE-like cation transporter